MGEEHSSMHPDLNPASHTAKTLPIELREVSGRVKTILEEALESDGRVETLHDPSIHLITAGGKMLRPFLVVKSCEVVGGDGEDALPAGAAVELLHTFSLVHDDIIDGDEKRRGVPTVHAKWGIPAAIIAGDFLFASVYKILVTKLGNIPLSRTVKIMDLITDAATTLCEGQMMDMRFPMLEEVAEKEYMAMIAKKTAYLFKTAAEIGATVGGGSKTEVRRLGEFAYNSGIAFQIVDDILGLTGDEEKLGKPVGSDLREGKKTLPIIHALKRATSTQKHIILKAMRQSSTQSNILKAKDIIVKLGSIDYAIRKSKEYAQRGIRQLDSFQDNSAKNALVSYTSFLVDRQF